MSLHRLIYTSVPKSIGPADIDDILKTSRRNNKRDNLTGMLVFTSDFFLQVIEGNCDALSRRLILIGHDQRHERLQLRRFEQVDERLFSAWDMHYVAHNQASLATYGGFFAGARFQPELMTASALLKMCQRMANDVQTPLSA
ncbi:BLUF domain-containing protein [Phycobacter azelaicus]|uniref:BLUF domain-containing protein n=1 Tax=Phycobacter azelaicus TaxID=2668075 RepID=UPI001866F362